MNDIKQRDKKIATIISICMYVSLCLSVLLMYLFNDYWGTTDRVFHISTELICMIVSLVMYRLHLGRHYDNDEKERYFTALCILVFYCLMLDFVSRVIDGAIQFIWLNKLINTLVFIAVYIHGALFNEYIFSYITEKSASIKKIISIVNKILIAVFAIRMILIASGQYFIIDENGFYIGKPALILSFVFIPLLTLFDCGVAAGAGVQTKRVLLFLVYPLSTALMFIVVLFYPDYTNMLLTMTLSGILIYCSTFSDKKNKNIDLSESLQMYISEDVVNQLDSKENADVGGKTENATMLFCTLHGFSEEMEAMEPEDALVLLNCFYSDMTKIIDDSNGILLEYPGYGLFCIFGNFSDCPDHAKTAIAAAYKMREQLASTNAWAKKKHYPSLKLGIGIDTGDIVIGNVGSENHMRYSAIGQHVNLASRTETYADDGDIIITQNTFNACGKSVAVDIAGTIVPKGVSSPMHVYKVSGITR